MPSYGMLRLIARAVATVGFVGYAPVAPGSAGSLVGWIVGLILASVESAPLTSHATGVFLGVSAGVIGCFLIGVLASGAVERQSGEHDPATVVIDEFVGMWAVVQACPFVVLVPWLALASFALFRVFDIFKPPPLKWLARSPGGWGIMLDDLGASIYAAAILWLLYVLMSRYVQPLG